MKQRTTLYTEDTGRNVIEQILSQYVDGYTLMEGTVVYKGTREFNLMIIIVHEAMEIDNIKKAAQEIKFFNEREAILLVTENIEALII